ncbi:RidA family protein [Amycolatopsis sp.]|uniref:RidA family protein n=1 Tax=Amycolatopsis sp. TaxID=37632 RepID=UPI002B5CFFD9|nr:RidA family protein [Amycolatopsis sp.]HVV08888.1 RidA family protein [Amycolatopsis sp.]
MSEVVAAGDYATARVAGGLVFTAGMTPRAHGGVLDPGRVEEVGAARARELAGLAASRAVTAAHEAAVAAGFSLDSAVSLTVYLRTAADFTGHSAIADGATETLRAALGGPAPARAAIGVTSLPAGAAVEVSAVFTTHG